MSFMGSRVLRFFCWDSEPKVCLDSGAWDLHLGLASVKMIAGRGLTRLESSSKRRVWDLEV